MAITRKSKHEWQVEFGKIAAPFTNEDLKFAQSWCTEKFGPSGRKAKFRWRYGWVDRVAASFYFRNEKDALMFLLRWS